MYLLLMRDETTAKALSHILNERGLKGLIAEKMCYLTKMLDHGPCINFLVIEEALNFPQEELVEILRHAKLKNPRIKIFYI